MLSMKHRPALAAIALGLVTALTALPASFNPASAGTSTTFTPLVAIS